VALGEALTIIFERFSSARYPQMRVDFGLRPIGARFSRHEELLALQFSGAIPNYGFRCAVSKRSSNVFAAALRSSRGESVETPNTDSFSLGGRNTARWVLAWKRGVAGIKARTLGRSLVARVTLLLIAVCIASDAADVEKRFDIKAQPLAEALMIFGAKTGAIVMAPTELTTGKTSKPVIG
jgi:hypothetical protein